MPRSDHRNFEGYSTGVPGLGTPVSTRSASANAGDLVDRVLQIVLDRPPPGGGQVRKVSTRLCTPWGTKSGTACRTRSDSADAGYSGLDPHWWGSIEYHKWYSIDPRRAGVGASRKFRLGRVQDCTQIKSENIRSCPVSDLVRLHESLDSVGRFAATCPVTDLSPSKF